MNDSPSGAPPKAPGWVKALGIALLALAIIVVLAIILIGGGHGPGRHG